MYNSSYSVVSIPLNSLNVKQYKQFFLTLKCGILNLATKCEGYMRINKNKEIVLFLKRCEKNLTNDAKNDFLFKKVTKENEKQIQQLMKKAAFAEFLSDEKSWPSLFLSTEEYLTTPYYQNVSLHDIKDDNVQFKKQTIKSNVLFNVDEIQPDPLKELNDWMKLRALDKPYEANVLMIDNQLWMLDIYSEAMTINPKAQKAHGKVLTFGLGIGYFVYMALLNKKVEKVTVIENNEKVISIFNEYLRPQFNRSEDIEIIHADALDYFNKENIDQFDYVFVDVYQSSDDGLEMMEKMLMNYNPINVEVDFWIEQSVLEILTGLLFYYFKLLSNKQAIYHDDDYYHHLLLKIDKYFSAIDSEVNDVDQLKEWMYSNEVKRKILSIAN